MASAWIRKVFRKIKTYGELVMFSHTLFSLPFALVSMFLAADGLPSLRTLLWILTALFAGRNGANALNRYADASIDAKNPRTSGRHIPAGRVKAREALGITIACYILFVIAAASLNRLCLYLSPAALALFTLYSYTKRFTWLCHIILGITCAGAPVGAWIAVTGSFALAPLVLAAAVALWVAGFDILYGTQDIDFDRREGLYSIPARFGLRGALWIARAFHAAMWLLLLSLPLFTRLGAFWIAGNAAGGVLLITEHYFADPHHRVKMDLASYHLNQVLSVLLLAAAAIDLFRPGGRM